MACADARGACDAEGGDELFRMWQEADGKSTECQIKCKEAQVRRQAAVFLPKSWARARTELQKSERPRATHLVVD